MVDVDELLEKINELNINNHNLFRKKFNETINLKQKEKFNDKFPNLELNEYKMMKCINDTIYYYKFSSEDYSYEFEINISNTKAKKYLLKFYVNGESEHVSKKITEKQILNLNKLDIKKHFVEIGDEVVQVDITIDELENIINYLFFNKKFIYNI